MKYILIINNELQLRRKRPVTASMEMGVWTYYETLSRGENRDITPEINGIFKKLFDNGLEHPLKNFTINLNFSEYFDYEVNEILRILHVRSEIYKLNVELFREYNESTTKIEMFNMAKGERTDIMPYFLQEQEDFLIHSIVAFSRLVSYIEISRNSMLLNNTFNTGIAFMVDDDRWMNMVNLHMVGIDNPFSWLIKRPSIAYSTLVAYLHGNYFEEDFNKPQIFSVAEKGGNLTYYTATAKDILSFLNIDPRQVVSLTSAFVVQLIGVALLKALKFDVQTKLLPTPELLYIKLDDNNEVVGESWNPDELSGKVIQRNQMSLYLESELGRVVGGTLLPIFERMRLT